VRSNDPKLTLHVDAAKTWRRATLHDSEIFRSTILSQPARCQWLTSRVPKQLRPTAPPGNALCRRWNGDPVSVWALPITARGKNRGRWPHEDGRLCTCGPGFGAGAAAAAVQYTRLRPDDENPTRRDAASVRPRKLIVIWGKGLECKVREILPAFDGWTRWASSHTTVKVLACQFAVADGGGPQYASRRRRRVSSQRINSQGGTKKVAHHDLNSGSRPDFDPLGEAELESAPRRAPKRYVDCANCSSSGARGGNDGYTAGCIRSRRDTGRASADACTSSPGDKAFIQRA
jgi:hypothetical protein